jgi:predicted transport protein
MAIFRINKNKVIQCSINEDGFGDEFALRDFFADNLGDLLGIKFIAKEYPILEGRIDTLGLDENNSPVIIEYKWKENEEILAQGLFYYNWLIKNKKHFELLVSNNLGKNITVKWEQPRVILIARGFGRYTIGAVQQQKHIELITYNYYHPDILQLENVYTPTELKLPKKPQDEVDLTEYNLEYHLNIIRKKFNLIRSWILGLPDVEEKDQQKSGITYKTTKSFARFEFRPTWIQVLLRDPQYELDTKKLVKDVTSHEWGYRGMFKLNADTDTDYLFALIKQSYDSTL